jgi:polysaccharide export outer membrane protein
MKKFIVLIIVALMSLAAFGQTGDSAAATKADAPKSTPVDSSYTIGPEDVVEVAVWKEPDFSGTVPVRPDGKISLALIGDVQAAGKTPEQLTTDLTGLLKKYIAEPRVTVTVTAINSRKVYLLGEVNRPGPVIMTPSMTVLQAIAAAGGPTAYANTKKMYVLRKDGANQTKLAFNYKEAIKGNAPEQNVLLKPGDTIVVP